MADNQWKYILPKEEADKYKNRTDIKVPRYQIWYDYAQKGDYRNPFEMYDADTARVVLYKMAPHIIENQKQLLDFQDNAEKSYQMKLSDEKYGPEGPKVTPSATPTPPGPTPTPDPEFQQIQDISGSQYMNTPGTTDDKNAMLLQALFGMNRRA